MHTFEPGQKVRWSKSPESIRTILRYDEGRYTLGNPDETELCNVRPSELTPADPVPDWATLKVRELCAAEWEEVVAPITARRWREGIYDNEPPAIAFAKYLRAKEEG